ncbi:hypothetical protein M2263_004533 [Providencia alcalifaciens]|nr:hypothetical protein [Providencia alcalifaciens]
MKSLFLMLLLPTTITFITPAYSDDSLNSSYAKLLALSLTNDISASKLDSEGLSYEKYSFPYTFKNLYEYDDYSFSVQLRGNYLKVKASPMDVNPSGKLRAHWDILSVTTSPKITYKINNSLKLENEIEFGYANMNNKSTFSGDNDMKESLREIGLLGWSINSFQLAPKIGLINTNILNNNHQVNFHGNVSYMFMHGINNDKELNVNNNTGTWSVGGEYIMADLFNIKDKPFSLILSNDIGGFYGNDYRELSFGFINNTSLAIETPVNVYNNEVKFKTGIGYLASDNAHGITLTFEIR